MAPIPAGTLLPQSFYERNVTLVARDLLGKVLVRKTGTTVLRSFITEVEAYDGPHDRACHAAKGKTKRTEVMFGAAGHWYVYLIYGIYEMLNIVTGECVYPAAVLIRGTDTINGPGRLTRALKITRELNGKSASRTSGLWIEDGGITIPKKEIIVTPRIGVDYAGPVWAKKEYRFVWEKK
jgi:DNA-3-methyladenine glycosylase